MTLSDLNKPDNGERSNHSGTKENEANEGAGLFRKKCRQRIGTQEGEASAGERKKGERELHPQSHSVAIGHN
jgi:hypothetical protein